MLVSTGNHEGDGISNQEQMTLGAIMKSTIVCALLSCSLISCGEADTSSLAGGSSSGGLTGSTPISCSPTQVADAGYQLDGKLLAEGIAIVTLSRIGFAGLERVPG